MSKVIVKSALIVVIVLVHTLYPLIVDLHFWINTRI